MDKTAFFNMSYGLYVVSTKDEDRNVGCVVNSVFQITSSPATLAISINKDNYTNPCILKKGSFAVSILSESASGSIISAFGFSSSKEKDKFENLATIVTDSGLPVLTSGICSYLECKVINTVDCFTHTIVIAEIIDAKNLSSEPPMTYSYYHKVIKGKAPKKAPTYVEPSEEAPTNAEPPKAASSYICEVCGYEYPGDDFESLPDSYECPICNAPKSVFK